MMQSKAIMARARESLQKNFKSFGDPDSTLEQLAEELDLNTLDQMNDDYLKYCYMESLRMDTPIPLSTAFCMTEDTEICGVNIRAGEMMQMNIY